jgi:Zn-dependent protease
MSVLKTVRDVVGRVLAYTGAAVFFIGDRYLHEVKHIDYLLSFMIAIGAALLLMLLAYAIGFRTTQKKTTDES